MDVDGDRIMTAKEASSWIGISTNYFYILVRKGAIKAYQRKACSTLHVRESEVRRFVMGDKKLDI